MQGNKDKTYQLKKGEESLYHLKIVKKTILTESKSIREDVSYQMFTKKEYEQFKKFKPADVDEFEILHDPTKETPKKEVKKETPNK